MQENLKEMVKKIAHILNIEVNIDIDRQLIRPSDNEIIIGSNDKIIRRIGWNIQYQLEQSLKDLISYWQGVP